MSTSKQSSGNPSLDAGRPETSGEGQIAWLKRIPTSNDIEAARYAFRCMRGDLGFARSTVRVLLALSTADQLDNFPEFVDLEAGDLTSVTLCAANLLLGSMNRVESTKCDAVAPHLFTTLSIELWPVIHALRTTGKCVPVADADDVSFAVDTLELALPRLDSLIAHMDELDREKPGESRLWEPGAGS